MNGWVLDEEEEAVVVVLAGDVGGLGLLLAVVVRRPVSRCAAPETSERERGLVDLSSVLLQLTCSAFSLAATPSFL